MVGDGLGQGVGNRRIIHIPRIDGGDDAGSAREVADAGAGRAATADVVGAERNSIDEEDPGARGIARRDVVGLHGGGKGHVAQITVGLRRRDEA